MPKLIEGQRFPVISLSPGEIQGLTEYSQAILAKKKDKGRLWDRITSEAGESAVDFLMETLGIERKWMRGRFHYDFASPKENKRIEIKTRKFYASTVEELDVRLDFREWESASEATHLCPVIFRERGEGADIISPGLFSLGDFIAGCTKDKAKVPRDYKLKMPCYRTTWGIVQEDPKNYGFLTWEEFKKL